MNISVKFDAFPTIWLLGVIETDATVAAVDVTIVKVLVLSESITDPELDVTEILIELVGLSDLGFVTWFSLTSNGKLYPESTDPEAKKLLIVTVLVEESDSQ